MDKRDRSNRGYAVEIRDLYITLKSIDPEYRCEPCKGVVENRRLDVLKLVRKDSGYPSFSARWDQKEDKLDIDIDHPSRDVRNQFKHGKNGYGGHWTRPAGDPGSRRLKIVIKTPEGTIFDGTASFHLTREFRPSEQIQFGDHLEAEVVRHIALGK